MWEGTILTLLHTLRFDSNCTIVFAFNLLCSMSFLSICTLLLAIAQRSCVFTAFIKWAPIGIVGWR